MPNTPRIITNDQLKAAARQAIEDGTLLALSPVFTGVCAYEVEVAGKTYNCAIGAALNSTEIAEIKRRGFNRGTDALSLESRGIVRFESAKFANKLQSAHDFAADGLSDIAAFKALIGYSETEAAS